MLSSRAIVLYTFVGFMFEKVFLSSFLYIFFILREDGARPLRGAYTDDEPATRSDSISCGKR